MIKSRFTCLLAANRQLNFLISEKQKRASELLVANKELLFQNDEKENRAAELITANKKLLFENGEKEKRATELAFVNSELRKTEKSQREYIAGLEKMLFMVSHEVRQPVTQIMGLSSLLGDFNRSDGYKKILDYIRESATQLDVFTRKLTKYLHDLVHKVKNKK